MTQVLLIYKQMAAILADTTAIGKNRKNEQQKFMFRGIDDVMNELHSSFAAHKVFLTTEVLDIVHGESGKTASGNTMHHLFQKIKFTFHAEDGSSVSSVVWGEAKDTGDKASNKCMSIALKYCLLQAFLIPTEDMAEPDAETPPPTKNQNQQQRQPDNKQNKPGGLDMNAEYTAEDAQKVWLHNEFKKLGLRDEHKAHMQAMNAAVQRMPLKNIVQFITEKTKRYLYEYEANKAEAKNNGNK